MDAFFAAIGLADASLFVRAIVAFLICLALLALLFVALGALTGRSPLPQARSGGRQPRLGVIEETSVDAKRRLVLVRRDNAEHLILTGGPNDLLLEGPILRGAAKPRPEAQRRANTRIAEQVGAEPSAAPAAEPVQASSSTPSGASTPGSAPANPSGEVPSRAARGAGLVAPTATGMVTGTPGMVVAARDGSADTAREDTRPAMEPITSPAEPRPDDMETPVPEPARASTATPLPVPSIAVSEPVAPSDPPAGHLRDDAALADAFARDFEADLGDVTDPDAVAEKAEAHAVGRTVTDVEAAEPGSDASDDAPRIGSLSEMDDLLSPSTPPGAIPPRSAPEPTPAPLSQAEDAVPAGPDPITPPRTRGQVPLDDEPTPRFPRFLREGGREAPRPPEPREAEVVVTEGARPVAGEDDPAPEAPGTRPFEALYRARDGAAARPSPILPSRGPEPAAAPSEEVPETTPADAPEMQSLEAQMESLLRELTERGKPGGHGPDEGNN